MTIQLKRIIIDAASRPLMAPVQQPKMILYSAARIKGYVPSAALQSFGAPPTHRKLDRLVPVKNLTPSKTRTRLWKLGVAVGLLLIAGIALADPWHSEKPTHSLSPATPVSTVLQGKVMLPNPPSSNHSSTTAVDTTLVAGVGGAAGAAMTLGLMGVAALRGKTRPRRSVPIPLNGKDADTGLPEQASAEPVTPVQLEEPAPHGVEPARSQIREEPALFGLAFVEPQAMLALMKRAYPKRRIKPASGSFALTSVTGHNTENQDHGVAFDFTSAALGPIQVSIISDGCGGHFGGRSAAYTAVSASVESLMRSTERNLIDAAKGCLEAASQRVASVGTSMWGPSEFRCTLIVLLANQNEYALAYIGDGGADVRRSDGTWERLLTPQQDEKTGWLTGSLGPNPYGNYVLKTLDRKPGDFLVAGTDGIYVAEVTDLEGFWAWPMEMASKCVCPSDLGSVLDMYVSKCLEDHPDIFDDNVTALVLTTPQAEKPIPEVAKSHRVATQLSHAMTDFYEDVAAMGR